MFFSLLVILKGHSLCQLKAEQTLRISPSEPVLTPILLILTMDLPNSTLNVNPSNPLTPKNLWTKVLVELSVHSSWSDSRIPRPFLRLENHELSKLFSLPLSSATRFELPLPLGHIDLSWGRKVGSMDGSGRPVPLKLYSLSLKKKQAVVPIVWPPAHKIYICRFIIVLLFES